LTTDVLAKLGEHSSQTERFEVDGANAARDFLKAHKIAQSDIDLVWTAIALHTTPGIPVHMHPVIALVTAGVEVDVLGIGFDEFPNAQREAVVAAYPRTPYFKENIIQAFCDGIWSHQSCPDCIIATRGYDFREGQV
jgi:hypothetical protein